MTIDPASPAEVSIINDLAEKIWWPAYQGVITNEQIAFMLDKMYSEVALLEQMNEGVQFVIARWKGSPIAFAGYSLSKDDEKVMRIHKLYVVPSEQGKGTGRILINRISEIASEKGATILELNVNRKNPAYGFYKSAGFDIYQTVDIPYYQFFMNDYVMRKNI